MMALDGACIAALLLAGAVNPQATGRGSDDRGGDGGAAAAAHAELVTTARATRSDALVVLEDGRTVVEEYFGGPRQPIELMSCTKSIVSLLVGILIDDRKIASVDAPVATWFPEWETDTDARKRTITVGHLLSHTSGLECKPTTEEIYASADFVQLALAAPLVADPGTTFVYNNKATNLLARVIERAAGMKMDDFARERLFAPIGIGEFGWTRDRAGNPHGMAGLQLHATDFAAIGQLLLDGGVFADEPIISSAWLAASMRPWRPELAPNCGLLWWLDADVVSCSFDQPLLERWRAAGTAPWMLAVGQRLVGRSFAGKDCIEQMRGALREALSAAAHADPASKGAAFDSELNRLGIAPWHAERGPVAAYRADGFLGNALVIVPGSRRVAVRQRRFPANPAELQDPRFNFGEFAARIRALPATPR